MVRVLAACCCLVLVFFAVAGGLPLKRKVNRSSLIKGIPANFPCYGPSRQELESANTNMLCGGKLCLVHCKDRYKPLSKIPFVYICNRDGYWTTIPFKSTVQGFEINWPTCYQP